MIQLALAICLLAPGPGVAARQAANDPSAQARAYLQDLATGHFKRAAAMSTAKLQAAAPAPALAKLWQSLAAAHGAFQSFGATAVLGHAQGYAITRTNAVFAKETIGLQVAVDSGGRVAGLTLAPPLPAPGARPPAAQLAPGWKPPPYARPASFREIPVTVGRAPWALPGFLTIPEGAGPFPAVVLVAGSGPEDADETIGPNKPLKDLAWGLASRGIAVLRYAKRTYEYPRQCAALPDFTVAQEYVEDAHAALALLAARPDIVRSRIFVLGHSEGGTVAPRIAASPLAAGMIALAGATQPLERSVVMQLRYLASLHPPQATPAMVERAEAEAKDIESPALQPGARVKLVGISLPASYVLDLRDYNPARAAAALGKPVLVLQGGKDYQVTRVDYRRWERGLAGDRRAAFHFYPALSHEFMPVQGQPAPADYAVPGHLAAQVVADIAAWVRTAR